MSVVILKDRIEVAAVRAFATDRNWACVGDVTRTHYVMASVRWATADGTDVAYIEDHTADVRSIEVQGRSEHTIVQDVSLNLPCFREDELLIDAETNPDPRDRIRSLCRVAAYRPKEVHHRYLAVWAQALSHPEKAVRRAAIRTAYSFRWPDFEVLLKQRIAQEGELRQQMELLLKYFAGCEE